MRNEKGKAFVLQFLLSGGNENAEFAHAEFYAPRAGFLKVTF